LNDLVELATLYEVPRFQLVLNFVSSPLNLIVLDVLVIKLSVEDVVLFCVLNIFFLQVEDASSECVQLIFQNEDALLKSLNLDSALVVAFFLFHESLLVRYPLVNHLLLNLRFDTLN